MDSADLRRDTQKTLRRLTQFLELEDLNWNRTYAGFRNAGKYRDQMSGETNAFLRNYYSQPNQELHDLTGFGASWL